MNDIRESIEKYNEPFSEQAGDTPEWSSAASPRSQYEVSPEMRVRCLRVALLKGMEAVEAPPDMQFPNVVASLEYILANAREHRMDPTLYERVWAFHRFFKEHMISRNVVDPIIAGETA